MSNTKEYILNKLSSVLDVPKDPRSLEELLSLPVWTLREVEKEDAIRLDDKLDVKTILDLTNVDLKVLKKDIGIERIKLERWIAAARIAARAAKIDAIQGKKILMIGLDNAGKSATFEIIKNKPQGSLQKLASALINLKPTKGVNRDTINFHDLEFSFWDMGGQKDYRNQYLEKPDYFFVQTDLMYYVIDAQDKDRHSEALEYFEKILSLMNYLKEYPKIIIFLHKIDPEVTVDTSLLNVDLKNLFKKYPKFGYQTYKTSIYDESSIYKAFSDGFKMISSHESVINGIVSEYVVKLGIQNAVLIDKNGFEIANIHDDKPEEEIYNLTMFASDFCENIPKYAVGDKLESDKIAVRLLPENKFLIVLKISIKNQPYFLGMIHGDEHKVIETKRFSEALLPWLETMFI
ncbi:MAG: hypothetical protein EAX96_13185 [Candidatus Lokiarchaeota archaeon]|nr:hypothetical protein [Candidatus Lokiarchaeota archaeon]